MILKMEMNLDILNLEVTEGTGLERFLGNWQVHCDRKKNLSRPDVCLKDVCNVVILE